jgi:hypothetical protein
MEEQFARRFYEAKAAEYRATLMGLAEKYGAPRKQIKLSREIRDALRLEAQRNARSVVKTYNDLLAREAKRSPLEGDELARHLASYMRERGRVRSPVIARSEVSTARLDATVSFFRENGIEPDFDFVGPAARCPVCKALKKTSPHPIERVIAIGYPHIQCQHRWKARAYSRNKLTAGGLRPGKVSAGRGGIAGIVGSEPMVMGEMTSERAAERIYEMAAG